jgi:predicted PurR-regulated permease PerM
MGSGEYTRRLLILSVFIVIGVALWKASGLLLILFGAIMFAVIFSSAATALHRRAHLPRALALTAVVLLLLTLVGGLMFLFGSRISGQAEQLVATLPGAFDRLRGLLHNYSWGPRLIDEIRNINLTAAGGNIVSHAMGAVGSVFAVVSDILLIFFGSVYLAAQPELYTRGLLSLLPPKLRPRGAEVLRAIYEKLWRWLLGQFVSMVVVGTAFGVTLAIIGVPSSIVLGLIAALLEFIPLIGPIIAAVPALLVAVSQGFSDVVSVMIAFVCIQQLESNLLVPFVQKRAVELPPVVALFSTVLFGLMFGMMGLIFAVPLVVTLLIAVQEIYVHDILGGGEAADAPEMRALIEPKH